VLGIGHGDWSREEWEQWGLSAWRRADITQRAIQDYVEFPTSIIHCAGSGSVSYSIEDPLGDFERTVTTTAHVLEYIRTSAPTCRVVYPSSASVYGAAEIIPIKESARTEPISQYGVHKLMAEYMIGSYARQFGVASSIVRLFSVYGCGLRKQLLWDACHKLAANDLTFMGTGDEVRDWLHVEDAAELMHSAVEHASPECPTVNGGSGEGATVREVVSLLADRLLSETSRLSFCGTKRSGDPQRYIADIESSISWRWRPRHRWKDGVSEYAIWWKGKSQ